MEDDTKIMRLARLLVEKHQHEALAVAVERLRRRLAVQDYYSAAVWAQVADVIGTVMPDSTPDRLPKRTQAPLDDLMDDPVMDAVVQDDEERRQEVYDTLSTVKRRLGR